MAWPFKKKSTQLTLLDNVIDDVTVGKMDDAYDLMNDTKGSGVFLLERSISGYRLQFLAVKSLLGKKDVDRTEALAALAKLKAQAEMLFQTIEDLK